MISWLLLKWRRYFLLVSWAFAEVETIFLSPQNIVILKERKHVGSFLSVLALQVGFLVWLHCFYPEANTWESRCLGTSKKYTECAVRMVPVVSSALLDATRSPDFTGTDHLVHLRESNGQKYWPTLKFFSDKNWGCLPSSSFSPWHLTPWLWSNYSVTQVQFEFNFSQHQITSPVRGKQVSTNSRQYLGWHPRGNLHFARISPKRMLCCCPSKIPLLAHSPDNS